MTQRAGQSTGEPSHPNAEDLFTQVAVAFGHGTGGIHVTPEAALELRRQWLVTIRNSRARWPADGAQALEFARVAGRLAAHLSLASGSGVIDAPDVVAALGQLSASRRGLSSYVSMLRGCPFCR